jgi:crotonobetainyl-CoA:carnitine CoA-transferase CaiB-like acyl-CoA transferase
MRRSTSPSPLTVLRHAPKLGEHTADVLESIGVGESDLEELMAGGVV